ncbi:MAG: hypothetical protein BJ554DRAFT_7466 [Olpidium bornovanus]|uniref:Uncharacterized protein n=1 Tax=Olpidium bornovanus TaxID=278681 RepID=A0A8H7ZWE8_9FUNG|nr:MAG: hypothetical protein BJ554DRAFT_7466 [Olpidium bornovanus]
MTGLSAAFLCRFGAAHFLWDFRHRVLGQNPSFISPPEQFGESYPQGDKTQPSPLAAPQGDEPARTRPSPTGHNKSSNAEGSTTPEGFAITDIAGNGDCWNPFFFSPPPPPPPPPHPPPPFVTRCRPELLSVVYPLMAPETHRCCTCMVYKRNRQLVSRLKEKASEPVYCCWKNFSCDSLLRDLRTLQREKRQMRSRYPRAGRGIANHRCWRQGPECNHPDGDPDSRGHQEGGTALDVKRRGSPYNRG